MIEHRPFSALGGADHGWLNTKHHFSFADYHDLERLQWGTLRVWNDDTIQPGTGFSIHSHADMEIITYVREGAIIHEDNLGNKGRTLAGDVQVMSAGTGIQHSEYNLESGVAHIFQIWISPSQRGHAPFWGSKSFPKYSRSSRFDVLASGFASDEDALPIHADARVLGTVIRAGETTEYRFPDTGRFGYLVSAAGSVEINGLILGARDGAAIHSEDLIRIRAIEDAELILVDTVSDK